jgi:hypothetical protein
LREKKEYVSSITKNSSEDEYKEIYSEFSDVELAYFAESYTQKHEDLHLFIKSRGSLYEFLLTDLGEISSFLNNTSSVIAKELEGQTLYVSVSKNVFTNEKLVSKIILEKPVFGSPDASYFLDYD